MSKQQQATSRCDSGERADDNSENKKREHNDDEKEEEVQEIKRSLSATLVLSVMWQPAQQRHLISWPSRLFYTQDHVIEEKRKKQISKGMNWFGQWENETSFSPVSTTCFVYGQLSHDWSGSLGIARPLHCMICLLVPFILFPFWCGTPNRVGGNMAHTHYLQYKTKLLGMANLKRKGYPILRSHEKGGLLGIWHFLVGVDGGLVHGSNLFHLLLRNGSSLFYDKTRQRTSTSGYSTQRTASKTMVVLQNSLWQWKTLLMSVYNAKVCIKEAVHPLAAANPANWVLL
jgi:hypothetical protein